MLLVGHMRDGVPAENPAFRYFCGLVEGAQARARGANFKVDFDGPDI